MIRTRFSRLGYADTRLDAETNAIEMTVVAHGSSFLSMTVEETKEFINVLYRLVKASEREAEISAITPPEGVHRIEPINKAPAWPVNEIPLPVLTDKKAVDAVNKYIERFNKRTDELNEQLDDPQHPSNRGFDGPTGAE